MVPVRPASFSYYWASWHQNRAVCHFPAAVALPKWLRKLRQQGEVPEISFSTVILICAGLSGSFSRLRRGAMTMRLLTYTANWIYTKPGLPPGAPSRCCGGLDFRTETQAGLYRNFQAAGGSG